MKFFCLTFFIFAFYLANAISVTKNDSEKKLKLIKTLQSKAGWNSDSWEPRRYRYGGRYRNSYKYNRYNRYTDFNNGYNRGYNDNFGYNRGYNPYDYYYYPTPLPFPFNLFGKK